VIFLDTDVVSELLRQRPHPAVEAWSKATPHEEICTASVVEAELRAGIERLPDGRRKRTFGRDLDLYIDSTLGNRVFPFDRAAARFYAESLAARDRAGRPVGAPDALLAATARAHGATLLATRNTKNFDGCGVAFANPWETT
jgi:toxin FitB